jgi:hypothetical protein
MKKEAVEVLVVAIVLGVAPSFAQRPAAPTQANGGAVSGRVFSQESIPIGGALVALTGVGSSGIPIFFDGTSNSIGQFQIGGIPAGAYTVCAHAEEGTTSVAPIHLLSAGLPAPPAEQVHYLDPCMFGGAQKITVTNGASQTVNLQLQRGMPVSVIVHDPNEVLSASGASLPLMSLVDSAGAFRAALQPLRANRTLRYSALVPIGVVYRLSITPNGVALKSNSLGAVPSTGTSVFSASPTAAAAFRTGAREVIIGEFTL